MADTIIANTLSQTKFRFIILPERIDADGPRYYQSTVYGDWY